LKRLLALLLGSALLLAACGGDSGPDPAQDPKGALINAVKALGDSGVTVGLSINSTPEDISLLSEGDMAPDQAQKLLDSSLTISTNGETEPENQQFELAANVAGLENAVELKIVAEVLYVRLAVRELAAEFGADTSQLDAIAAQAPPGFEFLGPAIEGQWLSMTGFSELAEQFGGLAGTSEEQAASEEEARQFADRVAEILQQSSTVTNEGSDDTGEHLVATIAIRDFYERVVDALGAFGGLADASLGQLPPPSEVPDQDISLDAWVDGGRLVQLEFDVTQLGDLPDSDFPEGVDTFALRLTFEEFGGDIEIPADTTPVDLTALMQGLMGGLGGGIPEGTGGDVEGDLPEDFCDQLVGAPEEVVSQFAEECPELQD
jgi:hypothetical protein